MERIKGIVVPTDWDGNGNVISLAIAACDEQEYLIENHQQIANLWNLLRQEVVAVGSIKCGKESKIIYVSEIYSWEVSNTYGSPPTGHKR